MRLLPQQDLQITRYSGGYWNDSGKWVDGATTLIDIKGTVQPYKDGKNTIKFPSGYTVEDAFLVRTATRLETFETLGGKGQADTTSIDGQTFEAFKAEDWNKSSLLTRHYKVLFLRKNQNTGGTL